MSIESAILTNQLNIPFLNWLLDFLRLIPGLGSIFYFVFWRPIFAILVAPGLGFIGLLALFIIWFERKICAKIQWRYGPLEIARRFGGIIQMLADSIRYLFQEIIVHREAHRPYFLQLPLLSFVPVLLPILVIPAGNIYAIRTSYAIPIIVAFIALIPILIVLIGWASNSKYAYLGSLREAFMYFAYEVPLIIAVMAMVLMYGSGDPFVIVDKQTIPGAILNPLACLTFLVSSIIATGKRPFDISEADQEIVFGPLVDYTGIAFGIVMMIAYEKLYLLCLLFSILFLVGWSGPTIPYFGDLSAVVWLLVKAVILMMIFVAFRAIYGRYRLDQTLRIGWKPLLSLSILSLAISIIIRAGGLL